MAVSKMQLDEAHSLQEPNEAAKSGESDVLLLSNGSLIADAIVTAWSRTEPDSLRRSPDSRGFPLPTLSRLDSSCRDKLSDLPTPSLVLLVCDTPSPTFENAMLKECRARKIPVLSVFGKGSVVTVGPLEIPGESGCTTCLQLRWDHSVLRTRLNEQMKKQFNVADFQPRLGMNLDELRALSSIVCTEITSFIANNPVNSKGRVGLYRRSGEFTWTPLMPNHDCPRCNLRPIDLPEFGSLSFRSRYILDEEALRVRTIDAQDVIDQYYHPDMGYVSSFFNVRKEGHYVRASATIQGPNGVRHAGHGSGCTETEAKQKAILEVVERSCSMRATNRRSAVFGSYMEFRDMAVDPLSFGIHDDAHYEQCKSFLEPIHANKGCSWLWAYSTRQQEPVLIPEQIAFYGKTRDLKRYVKDSSSGCSLGGSIEEAALHGIFEVLERDGFLNMWYARLPVPELMLGNACPPNVHTAYSTFTSRGYTIRLFDISHDTGIPAVLAVAIGPENHTPRVVCGSSCHLNPYEAVNGALREVSVQVFHLEGISEKRRAEGLAMWKDPTKITEILDHVVASGIPEAYPHWSFLLDGRNANIVRTIEDAYQGAADTFHVGSRDICVILHAVLEQIHRLGFDVIVVNLTNAEAAAGGFSVVKAVIPGMTPITFGYGSRRVKGLTRVFELPYKLGYTNHVLTESELNPDCHPFS